MADISSPVNKAEGGLDAECDRLINLLADQIERGSLVEARETVALLLLLNPQDQDARDAGSFLAEQPEKPVAPESEAIRFDGHRSWVNGVAFSPDGRRAVSCSGGMLVEGDIKEGDDCSVRLWDVSSGRELRHLQEYKSILTSLVFSPEGRHVLFASKNGTLSLWDSNSATVVRRFEKYPALIWGVAISPDGRWALSGGDDKVIRLWHMDTGRCLRRWEGHSRGVTTVAFSPNGRQALSGSSDNTIRLWDVVSGRELRKLEGHSQTVKCVVFAPDGQRALSGSADKSVRLWDLDSGRELRSFSEHSHPVNSVVFSPDGRWALTGSSDRSIRLWEVSSGRELQRFHGHTDAVTSVVFAPDGRFALSGSLDTTVRLWQMPGNLTGVSTIDSVAGWVDELGRTRLLEPIQMEEVNRKLKGQITELRSLVRFLLERKWLTLYQVNQIYQRRGQQLALGDYDLLESLGVGNMGPVFKARHTFGRQTVALKLIEHDLLGSPEAVQQFQREIQSLVRLAHPNIVRILEGEATGDRPFLAMEYIEGTNLGQLVQRVLLPVAQVCEYARQVALGLDYAYEHSLLHRDIKPDNLVLTVVPDATKPAVAGIPGTSTPATKTLVKILDWGLAGLRLRSGRLKSAAAMTQQATVGTPDYCAPEQSLDPPTADIRADIYSLGCTLYQLLTGQPPFPGGAAPSKLSSLKMFKHKRAEPKPVKQLRPDVPDGLANVLQKMMAQQPSDRYRTPALAAAALEPYCRL